MDAPEKAPWGQVVLIYLIGIFGMLVVSIAVPALGGIAAEFHPRSPALVGWVMSMPALAAALASLLVGWAVDRAGDRPIMLIGTAVVIAGSLGVILAPNLAILLAWRVVGGLGYVCMVVGAVTMISRLTSGRQRVAALALWSTVIPASFILSALYGALIAPRLVAPAGWRMAFALHAAGVLLLALAARAALPAAMPGSAPSRLAALRDVARNRGPFQLGLSFAAAAFIQTGFVATLPALLGADIGASEAEVHSFAIPAMACNVIGASLFGVLYNRGVAATGLGLFAVALAALCGGGLILAPGDLLQALLFDCGLMLALGVLVGMWAMLPQVAPSIRSIGATSGLITQITLLGVLFGPPSAFAALHHGVTGSLMFLGLGAAASLVALPVWRRRAAVDEPSLSVVH